MGDTSGRREGDKEKNSDTTTAAATTAAAAVLSTTRTLYTDRLRPRGLEKRRFGPAGKKRMKVSSAKEMETLKNLVPGLRCMGPVTEVEVVEQTIQYIDNLHRRIEAKFGENFLQNAMEAIASGTQYSETAEVHEAIAPPIGQIEARISLEDIRHAEARCEEVPTGEECLARLGSLTSSGHGSELDGNLIENNAHNASNAVNTDNIVHIDTTDNADNANIISKCEESPGKPETTEDTQEEVYRDSWEQSELAIKETGNIL